jgi:hypothetical protein
MLFCECPSLFVLEKLLGQKQPVGAPAHRGVGVEDGITIGLLDPSASIEVCVAKGLESYDRVSALSRDSRREEYRKTIPGMVAEGLQELRPYGIPSGLQNWIEWHPEGLRYPIVGRFDFAFEQHGIVVDLKTTEKLPSKIKTPHARQVALYCQGNQEGRLSYLTPRKRATYLLEEPAAHRAALYHIALACERWLALSDDPQFFVDITPLNADAYFFSDPAARTAAFETWGY